MKSAHRFGLVLGAFLLLASSAAPRSAWAGITSVELGVAPSGVIGDYAQKYSGMTGFNLSVWWDQPQLFKQTRALTTVRYNPVSFRASSDASVYIIDVMAGLETWGHGANIGLNPTFAVQAGAAISWFGVKGSTGGTQNQATYFVVDLAPGLEYAVGGPITLTWQMAANLTFNKPTMAVLNQIFSVRWSL